MKIKLEPETWSLATLVDVAGLCGWALAQAHARSGDPAMIAGYLGKRDRFDKPPARFSITYADQAERDYAAFYAGHSRRSDQSSEGLG